MRRKGLSKKQLQDRQQRLNNSLVAFVQLLKVPRLKSCNESEALGQDGNAQGIDDCDTRRNCHLAGYGAIFGCCYLGVESPMNESPLPSEWIPNNNKVKYMRWQRQWQIIFRHLPTTSDNPPNQIGFCKEVQTADQRSHSDFWHSTHWSRSAVRNRNRNLGLILKVPSISIKA